MTRTGSFNYLARSVDSSLYTNGRVFTMRDRDGSDGGTEGVVIEAHQQRVGDARRLLGEACHTLDKSGFELFHSPLRVPDLDFFEVRPVVERYYDECAAIVKDATKAAVVYAFDHNVRSARGKKSRQRLVGGQEVQSPARVVHGDYTLASAPQRLRDLSLRQHERR